MLAHAIQRHAGSTIANTTVRPLLIDIDVLAALWWQNILLELFRLGNAERAQSFPSLGIQFGAQGFSRTSARVYRLERPSFDWLSGGILVSGVGAVRRLAPDFF